MPTDARPSGSSVPLRLWPGVVIVLLQWSLRFGLPLLGGDFTVSGVLAGLAGAAAVVVWWLFFSRAPWLERFGGIAVIALATALTWPFLDVSVSTGAMGALFFMLAGPGLSLAFVLSVAATRRMAAAPRWATIATVVGLAAGGWTLVRTGGFTGNFDNDLAWRWTPSPEQRLLAEGDVQLRASAQPVSPSPPVTPPEAAVPPAPIAGVQPEAASESAEAVDHKSSSIEWPGFRGGRRDGIVRGVKINADWKATPPVELWRRPVGPGWSSFAVHGDVFYTQEQRGDDEIVAAYRLSSGTPVWMHRDKARFWESNGGAGPRGTPTLHGGRVYSVGATGILNALEAVDGRLVWSRNVGQDSQKEIPGWGFSSSPLILGDLVIVAAAGRLVAYDLANGTPRWVGPDGGGGYSSPHAVTVDGVPQVVLLNAHGATGVSPSDGTQLWDVAVTSSGMSAPIVQPAQTDDGDLLVGDGTASAMYRISVAAATAGSGWTTTERWVSNGLKPYYNDFVVHKGHAFGFDGSILACIDLTDGRRTWKGGRYGNGQVLLVADQDLLLVVSEEGELALVAAATDKFTELARVPAIEGKTWNHPVLAGDTLLVRNGEEMAAFRLALMR